MTQSLLAVGCSYTKGHGLIEEENNSRLWVNQLSENIACNEVKNIAQHGWSNESIFHATVSEITQNQYDIVLVGWSAIPRYNFDIGLETYSTRTRLTGDYDIAINGGKTFKAKHLEKIRNKLLEFQNDHWEILKLVSYVNVLIQIQEKINNKKVFFVNSMGPWDNDYFDYKHFTKPSELGNYTQNLISCETRSDLEIELIYNKMHTSYKHAGGIQEGHWLNLYQSLMALQVDNVSRNDNHPGLASQDLFAKKLLPNLESKLKNA